MKFTAITQTKHEGDNSIMREGYTSQAKKALAYAVRTAEKCGHNYVGTEHLLIGLLNVEDGTAGMVLSEFHVDAGQLTELIDRLIAPGGNRAILRGYAECLKMQKRRQRVLRAELWEPSIC